MVHYVYMLACIKDGEFSNFYTGETNDIERRFDEHIQNVINRDTRRYTGRFDAVKLVWSQECNSRAEAKSLEEKIKSMPWSEKMGLVKAK